MSDYSKRLDALLEGKIKTYSQKVGRPLCTDLLAHVVLGQVDVLGRERLLCLFSFLVEQLVDVVRSDRFALICLGAVFTARNLSIATLKGR